MGDHVQGKWLRHSHMQREWGKKCCQAEGERASPAAQASCSTGVLHTSPAEIHPRGWLDMQPEKEVLEELAGNENNAQ